MYMQIPKPLIHDFTLAVADAINQALVQLDRIHKRQFEHRQGGFFLAGSNTWKNMMGMRWNTKGSPKCSASDHKKFGFYGSIV